MRNNTYACKIRMQGDIYRVVHVVTMSQVENSRPKSVFATVGTTSFDELVRAATEESFLKVT